MARRHGVHGAEAEGDSDADQRELPADLAAMQKSGNVVAFDDRPRNRWGRRRHGDGLDLHPGRGLPEEGCLHLLRWGEHWVGWVGGQLGAAIGVAGWDDFLPAAA